MALHAFVLVLVLLDTVCGCLNIVVSYGQHETKSISFELVDLLTSKTHRPVYREVNGDRWLSHVVTSEVEGVSRWIISDSAESLSGVGYVDSWAVTPSSIPEISPLAKWSFFDAEKNLWLEDESAFASCTNGDTPLYLCSQINTEFCQYFFPISHNLTIYHSPEGLSLYPIHNGQRWMVSHNEPGSESGVAYIDCAATHPTQIMFECPSGIWYVRKNNNWASDVGLSHIASPPGISIYSYVKNKKHEDLENPKINSVDLNNKLNFPRLCFGTGGFDREQTHTVVTAALRLGYRCIDTASAYNNEDIIGNILSSLILKNTFKTAPTRAQVQLITKLWPTELGFTPTLTSFRQSLEKLQTGYIDLYLLHWPECNPQIVWMGCPKGGVKGTWKQSWRALEKLYAEGRVMSIGVSNFNIFLLKQLFSLAVTPPQVIQNYMDPLHIDDTLLSYCAQKNVLFQAYSVVRELLNPHSQDRENKKIINKFRKIALGMNRDVGEAALRWAMIYGNTKHHVNVGVVTRSSNVKRMAYNLKASENLNDDEMKIYEKLYEVALFHDEL
jgi:diketogulonate reductase-like aldo/keto reductase